MDLGQAIFLFLAGAAGAALNSVAGGGGFIALPALLWVRVPAIEANATQTVALWSGITASGGAYRRRLDTPRRVMLPLLLSSFAGGLAGALLLIGTPERTFLNILPWLMLAATLLFIFGGRLVRRGDTGMEHTPSTAALGAAAVVELFVATYGGYFGGGLGIMNLAMLSALGMHDIHRMNALKTVLGSAINGVAVVTFMVAGKVAWAQGLVMIAGAVSGGWLGAHYAQKLSPRAVRMVVIGIGVAMTAYFFIRRP